MKKVKLHREIEEVKVSYHLCYHYKEFVENLHKPVIQSGMNLHNIFIQMVECHGKINFNKKKYIIQKKKNILISTIFFFFF